VGVPVTLSDVGVAGSVSVGDTGKLVFTVVGVFVGDDVSIGVIVGVSVGNNVPVGVTVGGNVSVGLFV